MAEMKHRGSDPAMAVLASLSRKSMGKPVRRTLLLCFAGVVFVATGALVVSWKLLGHDSLKTSASESRGSHNGALSQTEPSANLTEALEISQSGKSCLSISLPNRPATGDKLVLVYVSPNSDARPDDLIRFPIRNSDEAEAKVRKTGKALKLDLDGHPVRTDQISKFNDGLFDFVYTFNSQGNQGVYVYCDVMRQEDQQERGFCATYLRLSDWSIDSAERLEIPLPTPADYPKRQYLLPLVAQLHVWLINQRGEKLAEGKVTVKRDENLPDDDSSLPVFEFTVLGPYSYNRDQLRGWEVQSKLIEFPDKDQQYTIRTEGGREISRIGWTTHGAFFGSATAERSDPPKYLLKGGKRIAKAK